jgi:hypothetical protein
LRPTPRTGAPPGREHAGGGGAATLVPVDGQVAEVLGQRSPADTALRLDYDDLGAPSREGTRGGQPGEPGADDDDVRVTLHGRIIVPRASACQRHQEAQ